MGNRLHISAMNHPLPLVRENSTVRPDPSWGGWVLTTVFPEPIGGRVVFFGPDRDDLLRRLGEAGDIEVDDTGVWRVV